MSVIDAAYEILRQAGEPLHYRDITRRALDQGLWQSSGATPDATLNARLSTDIKRNGVKSRFQRTTPGVFALREWGVEEFTVASGKKKNDARPNTPGKAMSFTDAAEDVLGKFGDKKPMHYREITKKALELGLLNGRQDTGSNDVCPALDRNKTPQETRREPAVRDAREGVCRFNEMDGAGIGLPD